MVIDSDSKWDIQGARFEAEALIPFRIQVPVYHSTAILEATALEFDVGITTACRRWINRNYLLIVSSRAVTFGKIFNER